MATRSPPYRPTSSPKRFPSGQKTRLSFEALEVRHPLTLLAPLATLANDTGSSHTDSITSDGRLIVTAAKGAVVEFSVQPGEWVAAQPTPKEGLNTILVR